MRWLTTLLLLILVAIGGAFAFFGTDLLARVGLRQPPPTASVESTAPLESFKLDAITKIELNVPGQPSLTLEKTATGWTQPGNWRVREKEVQELLDVLSSLKTRFGAIPLDGDSPDLTPYGLDESQKPVSVTIHIAGQSTVLLFGQPLAEADRAPSSRPAYVRVGSTKEVLRIAPDAERIVSRSAEDYRRRQLFAEAVRTRFGESETGAPLPVLTNDVTGITISGPAGSYTLARTADNPAPRREADRTGASKALFANELADSWKLVSPAVDRVDPAKLKAVLTTLPDLWVDGFVRPDITIPLCESLSAALAPSPNWTEFTRELLKRDTAPDRYTRITGFTRDLHPKLFTGPAAIAGIPGPHTLSAAYLPERSISTTLKSGGVRTVRIGNVSRLSTRIEPGIPMGPMAPPPMPRIVEDKYYFAKFEDNPLIFEVKADRIDTLFLAPDELRDATLARFATPEVSEIRIALKGGVPFVLTRKLGVKDAEKDEDKLDRWYLGDRLADAGKIGEFLDQLGKLEAKTPAEWATPATAVPSATQVTVVAQARVPDGDTAPPARTYTFQFGAADAIKKKVNVQMAGWERINSVDDAIAKLVERPAVAYRSRKQYDTAEMKLTKLDVTETKAAVDKLLLDLSSKPKAAGGGLDWELVKPVATKADDAKVAKLVDDLTRLEALEYLDENPSDADLADKYGFKPSAKPELKDARRLTVKLGFMGKAAVPETLVLAMPKPGEVYARRNGAGPIFTVAKTLAESLDRGSLDLLPLQLWTSTPDKVTQLDIDRAGEKYKLALDGAKWKLSGPFDAAATANDLLPLTGLFSKLQAMRYDALAPEPKHGFDKPALSVGVTIREPKPDSKTTPPEEAPVARMLQIGNAVADEANSRYAKLVGGPNTAVFVIADAALKIADKPALGWLDRNLLSLDPTKVTRVQIAGPTPEASLTLLGADKQDWKPEGAAFPLDKVLVSNLVFNASNPPVLRLAAYGPNIKWADFGLDKPGYTFTLTTTEKPQPVVLKLGKEEPTGERYIRIGDDQAVGVVSGATTAALARGKLELADRGLLAFDPSKLTGIVRKKGADAFELTKVADKWEAQKPVKFAADPLTVEELADALGRLRATKVVAIGAKDLKPYGLDAPVAEVVLTVTDGTTPGSKSFAFALKIGKPVEDAKPAGDRFVQLADANEPIVKVVSGAVINKLLGEPIKFKERTLNTAKFVDADKVVIERGDRKATFAKVDGTWKMTAPIAADAEQTDLDELVNAVAKFRADELVAEKPADLKPFGLDAPRVKVKFQLNDKDVLSVLVGSNEKDGARAHAMVEKGELVGLLDVGLTVKLLGEFRKRAVWTGVDASQVNVIAISDGKANMVLRKVGPTWADPEKPADAFDAIKVTEMLAALAQLKAERYVADKDANLELFGLKEPKRVIVLGMQEGAVTKSLQIGAEVGGSNGKQFYAKVNEPGRADVFVLGEADSAKLMRDRAGLLAKK